MIGSRLFSFLLIALLTQNALCQILPIGSGCGCQPVPLPQNLQMANNCGCRNNLLTNLPNGIQINNNLQIAKNDPCGANNVQLANLQNLQLANINGLPLGTGLQLGNPLSQDLLAYANAMPLPSCQNALQLSLQALMGQLGQQPCQCGCQTGLAPNIGNGILNTNLNMLGISGISGVTKAIGNVPCQPCGNLQVVTGQQEVILGNNPCSCQQSRQNIVNSPCPSQSIVSNPCPFQNIVTNSCPYQSIVSNPGASQNIISNPCTCQNIVSNPCSCQNIVSNPCSCQNIVSNSCSCQNIVSNPCPCQSCQNPLQYTIYQ